MDEMRWHPQRSNLAYFVYTPAASPSGTTKIVLGDVVRRKVVKSWIVPGHVSWLSEGNVSDDGRFSVLATSQSTATDPVTIVFMDFYYGTAGYDSAGTGHNGLGRWDTTTVASINAYITGSQMIDHINTSTRGNYAIIKYGDSNIDANPGEDTRLPQDQLRVLARGTTYGTLDTTSLKFRPMTMQSDAPRFAVVDSLSARDGWIYGSSMRRVDRRGEVNERVIR
jgi:hypothetical protein